MTTTISLRIPTESERARRRSESVRRSIVVGLLVAGALFACRRDTSSKPPVEVVKADPSASAAPLPKDEVDSSQLGFAARPAEPTKEANEAVHDGLVQHKAGNFSESRALFEKALTLAPDYALARFDLACAAARLGDFDGAKTELEKLLLLDAPAFAPRIDKDADLEAFRASKQGTTLRARIATIRTAWQRAIADGVSANLWREKNDAALSYPAAKEASWLRVGVWSPTTHRFLPMAPDLAATSGWYERGDHRAVVVESRIDRCQLDFCPNLRAARVSIFDDVTGAASSEATFVPGAGRMFGATIAVSPGSVRGTFSDCDLPDCDTGWMRIDGNKWIADKSALAEPNVKIGSDPWGATLTTMPKGWSIEPKSALLALPSGAKFALDRAHRDGFSTAMLDGDRALVATSQSDCDCAHHAEGDHPLHQYVVSVVEVSAARAHVWRSGPGVAALGIDAIGGVYLQVDEKVERWPSIAVVEKAAPTTLPDGVVLVAPIGPPDYCCAL